MTTDPSDPKPSNYPGQGYYLRAGTWALFAFIIGGLCLFGGLSLLIDGTGIIKTVAGTLLMLPLPVGLVFTTRSYVRAIRSTDVYPGTEDGIRAAAELHAWEKREAERRAGGSSEPQAR